MWSVNSFIRLAGSGLTGFRQRIVPGSAVGESIDIGRLICPLRYDIRVRIGVVRLLRDEWPLYRDDFPAFLERAPVRAYFVWFKEVHCARFQPHLHRSPGLLGREFVRRVHATARLWRSFERFGFKPSRPIQLLAGRSILSVNGKVTAARYFAGDGCHRIAALHVAGRSALDPVHYEVAVRASIRPLDNTAVLARHLPLGRLTYLRFISPFYCDGAELDSPGGIRRYVAARNPDLLPEVESVLAFDLPRLGGND